jgi:hypothetical protein
MTVCWLKKKEIEGGDLEVKLITKDEAESEDGHVIIV